MHWAAGQFELGLSVHSIAESMVFEAMVRGYTRKKRGLLITFGVIGFCFRLFSALCSGLERNALTSPVGYHTQ